MLTWFTKFADAAANANNKVDGRPGLGRIDAYGRLWTNVGTLSPGTGATDLGKAVDNVGGATDVGVAALVLRDDALTTLTPADGDYCRLRVDSVGALWTHVRVIDQLVPGNAAADLGKAIDAVAGASDTGVASLAVRDDALTTLTPVDGDYAPLRLNSVGALWVAGNGTFTVDNGGTFAVQADSVIPGVGATNQGKAVDAVGGATDTGIAALVLRDDALTTLTPVDGDYVRLRVNSVGALWVAGNGTFTVDNGGTFAVQADAVTPGVAAGNLGKAVDAAGGASDTGVAALFLRDDALTTLTPVDGDYVRGRVNSVGALWVAGNGTFTVDNGGTFAVQVDSVIPGTGATDLGKAVDAVAGGSDTGIAALAVRVDSPVGITPAAGDYSPLRINNTGQLWTAIDFARTAATSMAKAVDNAGGATDTGVAALFLRDDALTTLTPVDGDYVRGRVDSVGALWVRATSVDTVTPGTAAGNLGKAQDSVVGATDTGVAQLLQRVDEPATVTPAADDYVVPKVTARGEQWTKDYWEIPDGEGTIVNSANVTAGATIIAAGGVGVTRGIGFISVYNNDTSDVEVWVEDAQGTPKVLIPKFILEPNKGYVFRFKRGEKNAGLANTLIRVISTAASVVSCASSYFED